MKKVAFVLAYLACFSEGQRSLLGRSRPSSKLYDADARLVSADRTGAIEQLATLLMKANPVPGFNFAGSSSLLPGRSVARRSRLASPTMGLKSAIVGLPNVGKSTLFNALTEKPSAEAANFPFCTIEPNTGIIAVPDKRLDVLAKMSNSEKITPTALTLVDVAGLVKGASEGEGLGNKFLQNIRECDAIVHVVRCFENDDIIHVSGSVDPLRDIEVISLELGLSDLQQVENRLERLKKEKKMSAGEIATETSALQKIQEKLDNGEPARKAELSEDEMAAVKNFGFLSLKPIVYAANVADEDLAEGNEMVRQVEAFSKQEGAECVTVSAQVESELIELGPEDKLDFLAELGVENGETGLQKLVQRMYRLLKLQTYFTTGETETRAWTIKEGWLAPQAAGVIHTDFEKGFIRAVTVAYDDLVAAGSMKAAKEAGKVREEGKGYEVKEADCMEFRFN